MECVWSATLFSNLNMSIFQWWYSATFNLHSLPYVVDSKFSYLFFNKQKINTGIKFFKNKMKLIKCRAH